MKSRTARALSTAVTIAVLATCQSTKQDGIARARTGLTISHPSLLLPGQLEALQTLQALSSTPATVDVWTRGNSVETLRLKLNTEVSPSVHFQEALEKFSDQFVATNKTLWNINDEDTSLIRTSSIISPQGCSYTSFGLHKDGVPVLNAGIRLSFITIENTAHLVSVLGHVDGRTFSVQPQTLSRRQSIALLGGAFAESSEHDNEFSEGVVDSFFLDDSGHDAVRGYFGQSVPFNTSPTVVAVDSANGSVVANGWAYVGKPSRPETGLCTLEDPTLWMPSIRLDIETETPSLVSFAHLGGIPVPGAKLTDKALNFTKLPEMMRIYGDNRPEQHLAIVAERDDSNARQVEFEQYVGGLKVYAAGFAVRFGQTHDRVVAAFGARITNFRTDSLQYSVGAATAADTAWAATLEFKCGTDATCIAATTRPNHTSEQVFFSPRLIHFSGASEADSPAWRIDFGASEVVVSGVTGEVLFLNPREPVGAVPFTIDFSKDPAPYPRLSTNGALTPAGQMGPAEVADMNATIQEIAGYYELNYTTASNQPFRGFSGLSAIGPMGDTNSIRTFYDCAQTTTSNGQATNSCPFNSNVYYLRRSPHAASMSAVGVPSLGMPGASLVVMPGWARSSNGTRLVDAIAHEWGHGVTDSVVLWRLLACEERALDESLADILSETAFPSSDGSWSLFEGSPAPPALLRNLEFPSLGIYNRPITAVSGTTQAGDTGTCDIPVSHANFAQVEASAYQLSGVSSRMAQLIADGTGSMTGLGRPNTHRLYHSFIQSRALPPGGRVVLRDLGERMRVLCREDVSDASQLREFDSTHQICDLVDAASLTTRMSRPTRFGWFTVEGYGAVDPRSTLAAGRINPLCTIDTQLLRVVTGYGSVFTLELTTAPSPQMISIMGGQSVVRITRRGADLDPLDRLVEAELVADWSIHRPIEVELFDTFKGPAGWTRADCLNDPGYHRRVLLSGRTYYPDPYVPDPTTLTLLAMPNQYFSKWDAFGSAGFVRADGVDIRGIFGSVDGTNSGAVTVPSDGRCRLVNTTVRELQFGNHQPVIPIGLHMPLMSVLDHYSHSYSLQATPPAPQSLLTRVAWQQQVGARCAFQVAWEFDEKDGEDCLAIVNGLLGDNGVAAPTPIADRVCTEVECQ